MKWISYSGKILRRFAWAFVVAYMVAWHNVYKERADMGNNIEYHMQADQPDDDSAPLA